MARNPSPRQRISVACPHCGHRQDEPRQVISTLCRRCRNHFEVADGKVVVAPQKKGPAFGPSPELRPEPPAPEPAPKTPPIRTYRAQEHRPADEQLDLQLPLIRTRKEDEPEIEQPKPPPAPPIRTRKEEEPVTEDPKPPPGPPIRTRIEDEPAIEEPEPPQGPPVRTRSEDDPLPPGSSADPPPPPEPKPPSLLARIRVALRPKPPQRNVLCNSCGREFNAPEAANATNCPRCGAWLSLADFEVAEPWDYDIVTRGNVIIRRRGSITESVLECHNLLVEGKLEGAATCTGTLLIRRSGMIRGKIRCASLRIERRAKVQFIQPVEAGETVINGRVIGSIRSTSTVTLLRRSQLRGNITATELITKRGAKHIGRFRSAPSPAEGEARPGATLDGPLPAD